MDTTKRAVIYARVSTDRQKADGTIVNQLRTLPKWIEGQGMTLAGVYQDEGKSASPGKLHLRGGFQQLLADAAQGKFEAVVVADLDRITRTNDWGELGMIFGPLQKHNVEIGGPALGRMMAIGQGMSDIELILRAKIAYEENEGRKRKFRSGKETIAAQGGHVQGTMPYGLGYKIPEDKRRDGRGWYIDPKEGPIVLKMYKWAADGVSAHEIAKRLERDGIPGPQVNEKHPDGGRWSEAAIRILRSPIYRGVHRWNDVVIPVPAIVDDETWNLAQAALGRSKKRGLGKAIGHHLCHQLAVCAACGSPIYVKYGEAARGTYNRKYVCRNHTHRRRAGLAKCELPSFDLDEMDRRIWERVSKFICRPTADVLADLRGFRAAQDAEAKAWASDLEKYRAQLTELDERERDLLRLAMDTGLKGGNVRDMISENAARRSRIEAQMQAAQDAVNGQTRRLDEVLGLEARLADLTAVAMNASPADRRRLVLAMVPRGGISFDAHGVNVRLNFGGGEDGEKSYLPEITPSNSERSMVKNAPQLPGENVVVLRVLTG